jgi:hypothetical protein
MMWRVRKLRSFKPVLNIGGGISKPMDRSSRMRWGSAFREALAG